MDVSIIYVNWNCVADIRESIASVQKWTQNLDYELIVVDNASKEDISILEWEDIKLIRNQSNLGFGSGCNVGARQARGNFLLFLNPDTVFLNDVLGCLVSFLLEHPQAGCAGPLTLESDGLIHYGAARSLPSLTNEFLEHSALTFKLQNNRFIGKPYYSYWDHQSTRQVDALLGACMMFRRDVFEMLGGFDENFFLYYEEVDLCKRTLQAGYRVWYVHTCKILHEGHKSVIKVYGSIDPMFLLYFESAEKYLTKHHGRIYTIIWRVMLSGIYLARFLRKRRPKHLLYFKWGLGLVQYNHTNV